MVNERAVRITRALSKLEPAKVFVGNSDENFLTVRVVSEKFKGMSTPARMQAIFELLEKYAPLDCTSNLFILEAFTEGEVKTIPSEFIDPENTGFYGKAA